MFPELYRAHHDLHPDDLPFWMRLAEQASGPIVELGCGAGRVLLPLARAGRRMIGVELDAGMLALLRSELIGEPAGRVELLQADFTRLRLGRRFELIILPCNTYSTLSAEGRAATLTFAYEHLTEGGAFAAAMPSPHLLLDLPKRSALQVEEIFPHPVDAEPVQVSSGWRRTRDEFILEWRYDHLLPDGSVERQEVTVRHQLVPLETLLDEFQQAGFEQIEILGDFDGSPYGMDAENLIITARRA